MATYTESFDTSGGDTLGPDLTWVEIVGDSDIVSNRARHQVGGGTASLARADHALSTDDQYCQIALYLPAVNGMGGGPVVRKGANSTQTFYMLWADSSAGTYRLTAYKYVAGALTAIGSTVSGVSFTPGDTVRLEAEGTTLRGYINGSLILTRTDSSISSGVNCGFRQFDGAGTADLVELDNWEAGDLSAGAGSAPAVRAFPRSILNF